MKKIIVLLLIVLVIGFFVFRHFAPAGGPGGMMGGAPPVGIAPVIERSVQQWHEFSGRLVAVDSAQIRPRVAGTIEKIHFQEGEWVEKGQPLFTIDQRTYLANLQAAQARATLAEAEMNRAKTLIADKAIPQREFDQRKSDADMARAELTRARLDYDYTVIKAPISGRVSRAEITVGNLVDAGGNAPVLTSVVSSDPIYADFDIDEHTFLRYLQVVGPDKQKLNDVPVRLVLSDKSEPYTGHVQSFDNQLDTGSGTIRVRALFENASGALVPGLFASVSIGDPTNTQAILITDRAVGTDQSKKFVIVVGADNKTERREVKLGGMAEGLRIVESGLKPGEKIIVSGLQRVMMPGQPVTPEETTMDAPPLNPNAAPPPASDLKPTVPETAPAAEPEATAPAPEVPAPETPATEEKAQ
jgi:membrane fusion protein, multidrug efflux system